MADFQAMEAKIIHRSQLLCFCTDPVIKEHGRLFVHGGEHGWRELLGNSGKAMSSLGHLFQAAFYLTKGGCIIEL